MWETSAWSVQSGGYLWLLVARVGLMCAEEFPPLSPKASPDGDLHTPQRGLASMSPVPPLGQPSFMGQPEANVSD